MDCSSTKLASNTACKLVAQLLCGAKNNDLRTSLLCSKDLLQSPVLLHLWDYFNILCDRLVCSKFINTSNVHLHRIKKKITCYFPDFFWPSCSIHKCLSSWRHLIHNLTDLRFKTHIKHSICLIKYKK
uniref:Uncharacterized protein MANES_03G080100 n=1 Tax=Rhizophora mucronata TaxID=61149 RepID=A0A2P2K975_RHIMU